MATYRVRKTSSGEVRHQVQIRRKGYPLLTETFATKKEAQKWAMKTEAAILDGRFRLPVKEVSTVGELIDIYVEEFLPIKECSEASKINQTQRLKWWKQEIGRMRHRDFLPSVLNQYREFVCDQKRV